MVGRRSINELLKGFDVGSITFIELQSLGDALREARGVLIGVAEYHPTAPIVDLLKKWGAQEDKP